MARLHLFSHILAVLALTVAPLAHAEDLLDVYHLAQQNDPVFRAARAGYEANKQAVPVARSALLPQANIIANHTRNENQLTAPGATFTVEGESKYDSDDYLIQLRQTIFNYADFLRYNQSKKAVEQAALEYASAEDDLITRTAEVYLQMLSAQDNLDLAVAEKTAVGRQLELAQARLDVGLGTVTEVYEAQSRYSLTVAQEIAAQNDLADSRQAFKELVGEIPAQLDTLTETMPLEQPDPPDIERWVDIALEYNLGLLTRRMGADIAHDELRIQRAGHLPTLEFVANNQRNESDGSLAGGSSIRDNTDYRVQLVVPIVSGGLTVAHTTEARYRWDAALENLEKERRTTIRDTRAAYLGVTSQVARVKALREAVTAAESALEGKVKGFEAGLNSNIDVLDAQRDLYRAKRDYSSSRYGYLRNLLRLDSIGGRLDEGALRRINAWLK